MSFANRGLGMEHWVDEVVPQAIEEVSRHAGGRPVHVIGWSLGAIFALLTAADRPDLPIGSLTWSAPRSTSRQVPLVAPIRPFLGIAGERAGLVTQSYRLMGGAPQAAGPAGLPALVVQQAGHQADRARREARRRRLPGPGRGGRPVHREHDRLPRPDVRAALPPAAQGQPARAPAPSTMDDREISLADITAPLLAFGGAGDGIAPVQCVRPIVRPGHRRRRPALRDRPGRSPRHAHRPRGPGHHLADHRRVDRRALLGAGRPSPPPRPATKSAADGKTARRLRTKATPTKAAATRRRPPRKHRAEPRPRRDRREPEPPLRLGRQPDPGAKKAEVGSAAPAAPAAVTPDWRLAVVLVVLVGVAVARRGRRPARHRARATRPPPCARSSSSRWSRW